MRITTYNSYINEDFQNYLVKETSINYCKLNKLDNPVNVWELMKDVFHMHELAEEKLFMICLNTKNKPTAFFLISKGTVKATLVSTREIFIQALLSAAVQIVICHNHPSQDVTPSKQDFELTKKVQAAGQLLDIPLADHIIIGKDSYYSFAEYKLL